MRTATTTRREFLSAAGRGALIVGCFAHTSGRPAIIAQSENTSQPTIRGLLRLSDSLWCFDPVGLYVQPGQTVRFINGSIQMITITAYHPKNDNHELRIPEAAAPFDFGMPERPFYDLTLETEGTYDFFSRYQEVLGMVGRIVVGRPGGPGERPWGYGGKDGRNPIYEAILKTTRLLNSQEIVEKKAIRFPFDDMIPPYPAWD